MGWSSSGWWPSTVNLLIFSPRCVRMGFLWVILFPPTVHWHAHQIHWIGMIVSMSWDRPATSPDLCWHRLHEQPPSTPQNVQWDHKTYSVSMKIYLYLRNYYTHRCIYLGFSSAAFHLNVWNFSAIKLKKWQYACVPKFVPILQTLSLLRWNVPDYIRGLHNPSICHWLTTISDLKLILTTDILHLDETGELHT